MRSSSDFLAALSHSYDLDTGDVLPLASAGEGSGGGGTDGPAAQKAVSPYVVT